MTDLRASLGDRDALLYHARDLRVRERIPEALAVLGQLEAEHPCFSRLYQERGHCHILLRDAPAAIDALREAVRLNPTLPASWDMLAQLYRIAGDASQEAMAARNLLTLQQLPTQLVVANSLFADGDFLAAEQIVRDYLDKDRENVGALHLLARIRAEQGEFEESESLLESSLKLAPDYHQARLEYATVLLQRQKAQQARQQAEILLSHDPDKRDYLKQFAAASVALGDHEPVIDIYARLLADPSLPAGEVAELRLWRANALKICGRQAEAIADYRVSLVARPDYGVAWFGLANLKTYRFSDDEIARMRAAESRPDVDGMDRIYLCFALGKALEDREVYESSWRYYERGNAERRSSNRFRAEPAEAAAERLKRTFTAEFFATRECWGAKDAAPIFILGLPRSGSTLVEQILASHSAVEGTQELTEIGRYVAELCGTDPDCGLPLAFDAIAHLSAVDAQALGECFLSGTAAYRRLGRAFFIDKMPNNFWHIGLIHLILPNAIIIDVRREPMACCFSNLKQLFGTTNQEFTYGIEDVARYYRTYLDVMRHWDRVLPGKVLRMQYEHLVDDLEGSVRRLLEGCGLPFEPRCLAFHQNDRSVRTPSSEQVRRPISRQALQQWRHYASWLSPLEAALGDALTGYTA